MIDRVRFAVAATILTLAALSGARTYAQSDAPSNPYHWDQSWAPKFDGDRKWGSSAGVALDSQGHIWIVERCGGNALGCAGKNVDPIVETDSSGKVLKTFGGGNFVQPHGLTIDKQGNIWVTDIGAKDGKGNVVFKFSPDGKILMTLGKEGIKGADHDTFNPPTAVAIAPNGDIFVSDGHGGKDANDRIVKFDKDGKYLMEWGHKGTGPGEFDSPHCLAFDSKGRLFVGDRSNNRIGIFDQKGKFIAEWKQFSRPSGIFIDKKDTIYVVDSESKSVPGYGYNPGMKRGIRIGSAKDGKVKYFVPDPEPKDQDKMGSTGAEGIAADSKGTIYAAGDITQTLQAQKKYVK